jgi:quercetin dioxygenase-like cupin family protein
MTSEHDNDTAWEPTPIPAETFHKPGEWANINRTPYDQVSGVIYKRAMNIKAVEYEAVETVPGMGQGTVIARWVFSEQPDTEEGLLDGVRFEFLHDTILPAGMSTGQHAHPDTDEVIYVVAGQGMLYHRPTTGSPVIARPLRPGDAALIRGGEYHNFANEDATASLRLIVLGLRHERSTQ